MSKGIITLVEDDMTLQKALKRNIEDIVSPDLEVRCFSTVEEFRIFTKTDEFKLARVLIFDLANTDSELEGDKFSISKYIDENYENNRVPIIIYSGYLEKFPFFNENGTVFKIEKGGDGPRDVRDLVSLMYKTGFLDIFRIDGLLEREHPKHLHEVFTSQFRNKELQEILTLLHSCHGDECAKRVSAVFQRMALRALVNKLNSAELIDGKQVSVEVNLLEHFYRRTNLNAIPVWTGDILEHKSTGERVYVMRPKCDLERASLEKTPELNVLVCPMAAYPFPTALPTTSDAKDVENRQKLIIDAARHNPAVGYNKLRIIPPSPFYQNSKSGKYSKGSGVDLSNPMTQTYRALAEDYKYLVTLSDDFVNEIATRFGAFLVRPGIVAIHDEELIMQATPTPVAPVASPAKTSNTQPKQVIGKSTSINTPAKAATAKQGGLFTEPAPASATEATASKIPRSPDVIPNTRKSDEKEKG